MRPALLATAFAVTLASPMIKAQTAATTAGGPVTRVLAIGHLNQPPSPERLATMPSEVSATVQLYLNGKIDQWYARKDQPGVVFVLNVTDLDEARAMLEALPLGQKKLMNFDLIPLGPLSPLRYLLGGSPASPQQAAPKP